tara:strand:+ start:162 stop:890 length:729 start_codon:yes stop_codon:yes gene_type:complete
MALHAESKLIRLYSHSGLCNRLRLLSCYREKAELEDKDIEMHWVQCPACWTPFDELFCPIPRVNFVYKKHGKNARRSRPPNSAISLAEIEQEKLNNFYLDIVPLQHIQEEIDSLRGALGDDYTACHVRRTDICRIQQKHNKVAPIDQDFFDFIEDNSSSKVLIATDNKDTQSTFERILGDRAVFVSVIPGNGSCRWPKRTTSVKDAVIDLFLCIYAKNFMGTTCSSFSGFIEAYREGLKCQT